MESQRQSERENCRALVLGHDGTEILLKTTDAGFVLPSVEIPRWERLSENLTAALKRDWTCDAVCLFTPTHSSWSGGSQDRHYEVLECCSRCGCTAQASWLSSNSLAANDFADAEEFRVIEQCLDELDFYKRDLSSPFARPGWFTELRDWAADRMRPLGLEFTGRFHQYNASPTFSLIRFETTGPAVWFKAVGKPNLREFPITLRLAELFPRFTPKILASKPEWNGWLSREVNGKKLGEAHDIALWQRVAADLARLQIESISETESITRLGTHDLRSDVLLSAIDPFFELVGRLMDEQPKTPPAILSREELSLLRVQVDDALTLLSDFGIPNTLGHLDLNPWNIIVSDDGCVFLDWAEAYIGYPFLSLEYLVEHLRRGFAASADCGSRVVDAYKTAWRQVLTGDHMSEALALTPLAAVFAYAVGTDTWRDESKLRDPKVAGYFRSLARRMNREAISLIGRRSPCLG